MDLGLHGVVFWFGLVWFLMNCGIGTRGFGSLWDCEGLVIDKLQKLELV